MLDLENPHDFNEKINWLIVNKYGENEALLTDKYRVKEIIKSKNISDLHIPVLYKKYENAIEINLDELPDKFVLKCNHYSGSVFICKNKHHFNLDIAKNELHNQLNKNYAQIGLEYHYSFIEPYIIAEEYLEDSVHDVPIDYKFYCFNGNILVCSNRNNSLKLDDYDLNWNFRDFSFSEYQSNELIKKPNNLKRMIEIAEQLAENTIFVRVDLYEINNKIYFGELTFTPGNGMIEHYKQSTLDYLGNKLILPSS